MSLKPLLIHAVRLFACLGVPQLVAMQISTHKTDGIFRHYAIVNEEEKRKAMEQTRRHREEAKASKKKVVKFGR